MDAIIETYTYREDKDLCICEKNGVAYQKKMPIKKKHENYFEYCKEFG